MISMTSPTLDQAILFLIKTKTTGERWADVTQKEAMHLAVYGAVLAGFHPELDERSPETQALIDDGQLAEGLLGPLNVGGAIHYDFVAICAMLKAASSRRGAAQ